MSLEFKAKLGTLTLVMLRTRDGVIQLQSTNNPTAQLSTDGKTLGMSLKNKIEVSDVSTEHEDVSELLNGHQSKSLYLEPNSKYDVYIDNLSVPAVTDVTSTDLINKGLINRINFVADTAKATNIFIQNNNSNSEIPVIVVKKDNIMSLQSTTGIDMIYSGDFYYVSLTPNRSVVVNNKIIFTKSESDLDSLKTHTYTDILGNEYTLYANVGMVDNNNLQFNITYSGYDAWNSQYLAQCELVYKGSGAIFIKNVVPPMISAVPMVDSKSMDNGTDVWFGVSGDFLTTEISAISYDVFNITNPLANNRLEFTVPDDTTFFSVYVYVDNKAYLVAINGDVKQGMGVNLKDYLLPNGIVIHIGKNNPGTNDGKYYITTVASNKDIVIAVSGGITSSSKSSAFVGTIGSSILSNSYFLVGGIKAVAAPISSNPFSLTEKSLNFQPTNYTLYSDGGGYLKDGIYNEISGLLINNTGKGKSILSATNIEDLVSRINITVNSAVLSFGAGVGAAILPTGPNGAGEIAFFNLSTDPSIFINLKLVVTDNTGNKSYTYKIPVGTPKSLMFRLLLNLDSYSQSTGVKGVTFDNPATLSMQLVNKFSSNPTAVPMYAAANVPTTNQIPATASSTVLTTFTVVSPTSVRVDFTVTGVPTGWTYVLSVNTDKNADTPVSTTVAANSTNGTFTQSLTINLSSLSTSKTVKITAMVQDGNSSGNGQWINTSKSAIMTPQYGIVDYYNQYIKGLSNIGMTQDQYNGKYIEGFVSLSDPNMVFSQIGNNSFQLHPQSEWFGKETLSGSMYIDLSNVTMHSGTAPAKGVALLQVPFSTTTISADIKTTSDPQTTAVINFPTGLVSIKGPIVEVGDDNGVLQKFSDPTTFVNQFYTAPSQSRATGRQLYIKFDSTLMQKSKISISGPGLTTVFNYPRGFVYGLTHQGSVNLTSTPRVYPQGLVDMSYYLAGCTGLQSVVLNFLDASKIKTLDHFMDGAKIAKASGLSGSLTSTSSALTSAVAMFNNSVNIDMDLTTANFSNISSEPTDFATNSSFQSAHKPIWGTTPTAASTTPLDNSTYQGMIIGIKPGRSMFYITSSNARVRDTYGNTIAIITDNSSPTKIEVNTAAKSNTYFYIEPISSASNVMVAPQFNNVDYFIKWHNAGYSVTKADRWSSGNYLQLGNDVIQVPTTQPNVGGLYSFMFYGSSLFNDPNISKWTFSDAVEMISFMQNAANFNQPFTSADFSKCGIWNSAFNKAISFNQTLPKLNLGLSLRQHYNSTLGYATSDVDMMFLNAQSFSQDLSQQCVSNLNDYPYMFCDGSGLVKAQIPVWGTCPLNNPVRWNVVLKKGDTTTYVDNVTAGWIANNQMLANNESNWYDSVYYPSQTYLNNNGSTSTMVTNPNEYIPLCSGTLTFDEGVQSIYTAAFGLYSNVNTFLKQINFPTTIGSFPTQVVAAAKNGTFVFASTTPPTTDGNISASLIGTIKVPASAVNTYKAASGWSNYASLIVGY